MLSISCVKGRRFNRRDSFCSVCQRHEDGDEREVHQPGGKLTWASQSSELDVGTLITDVSFTQPNQGCIPGHEHAFIISYLTSC